MSELLDSFIEQFGASQDLICPTIIKDVVRQLELVETILKRCEESVAVFNA